MTPNWESEYHKIQKESYYYQEQMGIYARDYTAVNISFLAERTALNATKASFESLKNTYAQLSVQHEQTRKEMNLANAKIIQLQHDVESCQRELSLEREDNQRSKRTIEEQKDLIDLLKNDKLKLQNQNEELQKQHTEEIKDLKAKHNESQVVQFQEQFNKLNKMMEKITEERSYSVASSTANSDEENPFERDTS